MKRFLLTMGLLLIFMGLLMIRYDDIVVIVNKYISPNNSYVSLEDKNEYYRDYDFLLIQNTDNFVPSSRQDLLNIYYTALNAGKSSFTFFCPADYERCIKDVDIFANNEDILSDINNYVHPYNSFTHIETEYDTLGRVTINVVRNYTKDDIIKINNKVDELYNKLVDKNKSVEDNIRSIHDYIIDNTRYDSDRSDRNIIKYKSDTAYGPLFEGYAICGGYSDLMELFLEKMGIKSFKVASEEHIWNAVYINGDWYHLDLTWDDPVASDGVDYIEHSFFLIKTNELLSIETTQHIFDQSKYEELKEEA